MHRIKQILEEENTVYTYGEHLHKIKSNDNDNKINYVMNGVIYQN